MQPFVPQTLYVGLFRKLAEYLQALSYL
eukprot:Nitzschia sp. Nitz4//scaffold201_size42423//15030//15113//NITZ4_007372-RA/size42423-exonerate_protein2genome-gene-0.9-mRNA-1//-1//CDS//3329541326//6687//frame0